MTLLFVEHMFNSFRMVSPTWVQILSIMYICTFVYTIWNVIDYLYSLLWWKQECLSCPCEMYHRHTDYPQGSRQIAQEMKKNCRSRGDIYHLPVASTVSSPPSIQDVALVNHPFRCRPQNHTCTHWCYLHEPTLWNHILSVSLEGTASMQNDLCTLSWPHQ